MDLLHLTLHGFIFAELREVFDEFDKDHNGTIPAEQLGTILRALRQTPTDIEVEELIQDADQDSETIYHYSQILISANHCFKHIYSFT